MLAKNLSLRTCFFAGLATALLSVQCDDAQAGDPYATTQLWSQNFAASQPWHGGYYQQQYRQPLALVVPPTAHMRSTYSWGVSQNLVHPIHHQYGRSANYPGVAPTGRYLPLPSQPSHTDQYGVYYLRGPW